MAGWAQNTWAGTEPQSGAGAPASGTLTSLALTALAGGVVISSKPKLVRRAESAFVVRAEFKDVDGSDAVPTTLEYRVDNIDNQSEVADWTPVTVQGASNDILIPASTLQIIGNTAVEQTAQVTVRANNGDQDEQNEIMLVQLQKQTEY